MLIYEAHGSVQPLLDNLTADPVRMRSANRYGANKGGSTRESHPHSLVYFAVSQCQVRHEIQNELVGWSHAKDPCYQLQEYFTLPHI